MERSFKELPSEIQIDFRILLENLFKKVDKTSIGTVIYGLNINTILQLCNALSNQNIKFPEYRKVLDLMQDVVNYHKLRTYKQSLEEISETDYLNRNPQEIKKAIKVIKKELEEAWQKK